MPSLVRLWRTCKHKAGEQQKKNKLKSLQQNQTLSVVRSLMRTSAIHMKKTCIVYDKPVYLGMCILDISKTLMYDFHYNYMKKKYGEKAKLLFTDTDSLAYEIQTEDFYKDISEDVEAKFDTSSYAKRHPSGIPVGVNKKVIGMFKDECGDKIMQEFVRLRAKLYSYKMYEGDEAKKCKGIKQEARYKDR